MAGERGRAEALGRVPGAGVDVPTLTQQGRVVTLAARTTVGRDPACEVRLSGRRVSGLHARFTWTGEAWVVRDLGSTNGTFVDGVALPPGVDRLVPRGARIAFGEPEELWTVEATGPPVAVAVNRATGEVVRDVSGILALAGADGELWMVLEQAHGWVAVGPRGSRAVADGELLTIGGAAWRLRLPVSVETTHRSMADGDLALALTFRVGMDEETLRLTVVSGTEQHEVPPRANHYLLLTLARARLADHAAGVGVLQAGWREVDEICRDLALDSNRLNVDVHRLRRQLAAFGVPDSVVERREGRLRIGASRLVVRPG